MREDTSPQPVPFVRRLRVKGYRSIARCDVALEPLTVLVGFNASGKSNILDAVRFVRDALENGPAQAAAQRGGLHALLHRSAEATAESFRISLELGLRIPGIPGDRTASYGFTIGPDPAGEVPLRVLRERGEVSCRRVCWRCRSSPTGTVRGYGCRRRWSTMTSRKRYWRRRCGRCGSTSWTRPCCGPSTR